MPVTSTAAFGQAPNLGQAILTAAKSAPLSSSTNAVLLFTGGANGSIVSGIVAVPRNTLSSPAHIAIYLSPDSGTSLNIFTIGLLAAWTFSATTAPTLLSFSNLNGTLISASNPLFVPATQRLYASSSQALSDGIIVTTMGVDL